jgi:hypothetical protein
VDCVLLYEPQTLLRRVQQRQLSSTWLCGTWHQTQLLTQQQYGSSYRSFRSWFWTTTFIQPESVWMHLWQVWLQQPALLSCSFIIIIMLPNQAAA